MNMSQAPYNNANQPSNNQSPGAPPPFQGNKTSRGKGLLWWASSQKRGRQLVLLGSLAMLAVIIVAVGVMVLAGSSTVVPTYTNASALQSSDNLKARFENALVAAKVSTLASFKSPDSLNKVKSFYQDEMKKNGWNDKTVQLNDSNSKAIETAGGFALLFEKGNNAAAIIGYPGSVASANDIKEVKGTESFFMIIQGSKQAV